MDQIFISSMLLKDFSIRTFVYTYHFYVHQSVPPLQNLKMHISSPRPPISPIATEPQNAHLISMCTKPPHRYRTLKYTLHLHVHQSAPSLQNLCIHISFLRVPIDPIATEPLKYTFHLHVHQSIPSLQNLYIHILSPCVPTRPIATEPFYMYRTDAVSSLPLPPILPMSIPPDQRQGNTHLLGSLFRFP